MIISSRTGYLCLMSSGTKLPNSPKKVSEFFEFLITKLRSHCAVNDLKNVQEEHLRCKNGLLFGEEAKTPTNCSEQAGIEQRNQEISRSFSRLHGIIQETKSVSNSNPTSKLFKNILQWQYKEISDHSQRYRANQREYVTQLQARDKYTEQFVINFDEDVMRYSKATDDTQVYDVAEEELDTIHDVKFSNQQRLLQADEFDIEVFKHRDAQMNIITKSISELNQIFQEINTMVVNQGSLMDRIDYNIETVQLKVEQGALQISKAEKSARSARKLKCIMAMAGSVLLALLILIIQS